MNYRERKLSIVRPRQCYKLQCPLMPGMIAAVAAIARDPGKKSGNGEGQGSLLVASYLGYSVTSISGDLSEYYKNCGITFILRTKFI